jgi:VWFA-related protein
MIAISRTSARVACSGLLPLALAGVAVAAQTGPSRVVIDSPEEAAYVSGPTLLKARPEPTDAPVARVTFFVDGQLVCTVQAAPFECVWDAGPGVVEHVVRVVMSRPDGSRAARTVRTREAGFTARVDVEVVQVTASVVDSRGHFVRGLTEDAFRVFEDGEPRRIDYFAAESVPLDLVVALDTSQSMVAAMPRLKAAVRKFLAALRPEDRVTVVAFNENVFTLARPEVQPALRLSALDRLSAWGSTALYDAIVKAHALLGKGRARRAVVVFTDGEDKASRETLESVRRTVEVSDVALYMVGLGRGTEVQDLRRILDQLAQLSGGRAFFTARPEELEKAFALITEELSNQYLLSYEPKQAQEDEEWRRIRVELTEGSHRVRARQGYRASRAPSP